MMKIAQDIQIAPPGGFKGFGPLGEIGGEGEGISKFSEFISSAIGLITIVAFIWFIFTFLIGAIGIITSGGDKAALESAKKKIANGVIGLVVTVVAIFIIRLIGALLGIPDILNLSGLFDLVLIQ